MICLLSAIGIGEIILIAACAAVVVGVVIAAIIRKKKGKPSCGDCDGCCAHCKAAMNIKKK